jgi:hypothetical protein
MAVSVEFGGGVVGVVNWGDRTSYMYWKKNGVTKL